MFASHRFRLTPQSALRGGGIWPAGYGTLIAWFDATKLESLFQNSTQTTAVSADANPVGAWRDLSGNGRHVIQATDAARPLYKVNIQNGLPAIQFVSTDSLKITGLSIAQPITSFVVVKFTGTATSESVFDGATNITHVLSNNGGSNWQFYCGAGGGITGGTPDGEWHQFTTLGNGASSNTRLDGASLATGNPGTGGLDGITLGLRGGGATPLIGYIGEYMSFAGALSVAFRQAIEAYLKAKWATP